MNPSTQTEQYFAFYPEHVWSLEPLQVGELDLGRYTQAMSRIVWSSSIDLATIAVAQDGLVLFKFHQRMVARGILEVVNCFALLLSSRAREYTLKHTLAVRESKLSDIIVLDYSENALMNVHMEGVNNVAREQYRERLLTTYMKVNMEKIDLQIGGYWDRLIKSNIIHSGAYVLRKDNVVPEAALAQAVQDLAIARGKDYLVAILGAMPRIIEDYRESNYDSSLVMSWFIIEAYLYTLWREKCSSASDDTESVSSAILIRDLKQVKVIPYQVGQDLHTIRLARNEVVHNTFEAAASQHEARMAIAAIEQFIVRDSGLRLQLDI